MQGRKELQPKMLYKQTAYNIKKLMKFNREKVKTVAASVQKLYLQAREDFYFLLAHIRRNYIRLKNTYFLSSEIQPKN